MATEAQKRAVRRYDDKNTKQYHLKLNRNTDAAIIAHLDSLGNVQGYIKSLILADMFTDRMKVRKPDYQIDYLHYVL